MSLKHIRVIFVVGILLIGLILPEAAAAATAVRVLSPSIFSVVPFYWIKENNILPEVQLDIQLSPDHQRSLALMNTGQGEFWLTGLNVGAKGYVKGVDVRLVNVNAWCLDYVVTNFSGVSAWRQLLDKRIALPLQGGPLDFLVRYMIEKENLPLERFQFVYAPTPQAVQFLNLGQIDAAVLPEPAVSQLLAASPKAHLAIDIQEEWAKWHAGNRHIPYVGLFVHGKWAENHRETALAVAKAYAEGVAWMAAHPEEAIALTARVLDLPPAVAASALARAKLEVFDKDYTQAVVHEHLQEMQEFNAELTGGALPDAAFYW